MKDLEIERNSKQAEIEVVRSEMDRFKAKAENLEREKRKLEESLHRHIRSKVKETPRENRTELEALQRELEEQGENYR